jgi:hypothetical protein
MQTRRPAEDAMSDAVDEIKQGIAMDAEEDIVPVFHSWWHANAKYPDLPLSERLAIAEQAISESLSEGVIVLTTDPKAASGTFVAPSDYVDVLKRWDTWVAGEDGVKVFAVRPS